MTSAMLFLKSFVAIVGVVSHDPSRDVAAKQLDRGVASQIGELIDIGSERPGVGFTRSRQVLQVPLCKAPRSKGLNRRWKMHTLFGEHGLPLCCRAWQTAVGFEHLDSLEGRRNGLPSRKFLRDVQLVGVKLRPSAPQ